MAALSIQGREDLSGFVRAFAGSHRFVIDYLAEEVLSKQDEDMRTFLLQTAILDRMSDSLCNAVTGREDSQPLLNRLEQDNLFVVPLDDERRWYRYHRLFRDVLRHRLLRGHPRLLPTLHLRASAWYEGQELVTAAVDHALQADSVARAALLIDANADTLWGRGAQAALLRWLDALPEEAVRARPRLSIYYALVLFTAGRQEEAASHLEVARETLDTPSAGDEPPLHGKLDAARAFITFSRGDLPAIVRLSRRALDRLPKKDHQWRSIAAYTLGLAHRLRGDLTSAEGPLEEAVSLSSATGNHYVALVARLNLARLQTQRGHLRRAAEILRHAMHVADETGMSQLPVAGLLSAELGSVLTEWNDLDEAIHLLETATGRIARGQDLIATEMSYAFMVRALFARGELDRASDIIHAMAHRAEEADVGPWISHWILGLRLEMLLAREDLSSAARLAERAGLSLSEEPTYPREMAYSPLIRLSIAQGRPGATLALLGRLLRAAEDAGRMGRVIATLALRAAALEAQGDVERAMTDLARALSLAEPEEYVRVFVEQGPAMVSLLRRAATRGITPAYAARLLGEFDLSSPDQERSDQPLIEPLTERELEVLHALASDLTMAEIGDQLFVARSTVRSHAKSIYGKLSVHSRREAVRRARALGLLP
jgi:LuxR family maltose regulon positive regulatory protein